MDRRTHPGADEPDASSRELSRQRDDHGRDLLDEAVLPLFGLSAGTLAAIFIGGSLGTVARYLLSAHHAVAPGGFPWVTLLVNLTGSFAIGLLVPLTERVERRIPLLRPLTLIGFLGGWTTYSTLAVETTLLAKHGSLASCAAYLVATVARSEEHTSELQS